MLLRQPSAVGNHPADDGPAQACRNVREDHPHTSRMQRSRPVLCRAWSLVWLIAGLAASSSERRFQFRHVNPGDGDAAGIGRAVPARAAGSSGGRRHAARPARSGWAIRVVGPDAPAVLRRVPQVPARAGCGGKRPDRRATSPSPVLGGRTWRGCSKASVISSSACAATWRKPAAASAAGEIAVSERCARCPARVRNRAGDRYQA